MEAVSEILDRVGYNGIAVDLPLAEGDPHLVKAYLVYDPGARWKVRRVMEAVGRLRAFGLGPVGEVTVRRIADEDWLETWKEGFVPLRIGSFVVKPSWVRSPPTEGLELLIDPGMAFGTGLHPTTRQCLELLGELDLAGRTVLDVGTGSGILAFGAKKLGASRVVGLDVDPLALRAAHEGAWLNALDVELRQWSAADDPGEFDLVLANLVAPVLVAIAADLRRRTRDGGRLICAGIVADQEAAVRDALQAVGLSVSVRRQDGDWVALVLR